VNVVILDLEAAAADIGPRELVEARVLQVEDVPAVQADEVMMLVEFGQAAAVSPVHSCFGDEDMHQMIQIRKWHLTIGLRSYGSFVTEVTMRVCR